jgi:O-acetyl-ADP-ribose deacetylase (regulator of RNase III)
VIFAGQSNDDRDLASGFEVVPRLAGGGVALEIVQQRETPGFRRGSVHGQRLATSMQARLGEWVEIGTRVWVMVEALD